MRVLVCGSRSWRTYRLIEGRLDALPDDAVLVHGGAVGADRLADNYARRRGLGTEAYYADWDRHGKRAGIIRNLTMLNTYPDLVIAFWDGSSRGTKHTIDEARRRGIPVEVITPADIGVSVHINLDALERLAAEAAEAQSHASWGMSILTAESTALAAALDPVTVAALVRAARAVLMFGGDLAHSGHCMFRTAAKGWKPGEPPVIECQCGLHELEAAFAPFAPDPGEETR